MSAGVELTIRYGVYGEQIKSVALPIDEYLLRELMGSMELSNEPISLALASPGMFGGKGDAITMRRKIFEMRRDIAENIAELMVPALMKAFGVNDELDGYRISRMDEQERAWHQESGRLPQEDDHGT